MKLFRRWNWAISYYPFVLFLFLATNLLNTKPPIIEEGSTSWVSINDPEFDYFTIRDTSEDVENTEVKEKLLNEFRDAFKQMIDAEEDSVNEEIQKKAEQDLFIELDGMVIDNTRSRLGRNFYDLFYQYWEPPENASNYTIRISERPTPSIGSIVNVKVNDEVTFQYRLQPRYSFVEKASKYAVQLTVEHLETTQKEYKIY